MSILLVELLCDVSTSLCKKTAPEFESISSKEETSRYRTCILHMYEGGRQGIKSATYQEDSHIVAAAMTDECIAVVVGTKDCPSALLQHAACNMIQTCLALTGGQVSSDKLLGVKPSILVLCETIFNDGEAALLPYEELACRVILKYRSDSVSLSTNSKDDITTKTLNAVYQMSQRAT